MNTTIEKALQLSTEEKISLYHQLQEDLGLNRKEDLTSEQWKEIQAREQAIENGTMKMISRNEFNDFLKERRNGIQASKGLLIMF